MAACTGRSCEQCFRINNQEVEKVGSQMEARSPIWGTCLEQGHLLLVIQGRPSEPHPTHCMGFKAFAYPESPWAPLSSSAECSFFHLLLYPRIDQGYKLFSTFFPSSAECSFFHLPLYPRIDQGYKLFSTFFPSSQMSSYQTGLCSGMKRT